MTVQPCANSLQCSMQLIMHYTRAQRDNATATAHRLPLPKHAGPQRKRNCTTILACLQQSMQCDNFATGHTHTMAAHAITMHTPRLLLHSIAEHICCNQRKVPNVCSTKRLFEAHSITERCRIHCGAWHTGSSLPDADTHAPHREQCAINKW